MASIGWDVKYETSHSLLEGIEMSAFILENSSVQ